MLINEALMYGPSDWMVTAHLALNEKAACMCILDVMDFFLRSGFVKCILGEHQIT